eukprot:TRINITY_DN33838_c0_g1_i3.p1 TRINITY_DN33838_c0_g1~~TRINITY_DN33838_c0_g1_i3.p1  ORF type:complete len:662 (-),score=100.11 TRINITY_DN33838_c0_g1_i3:313-2298(-)
MPKLQPGSWRFLLAQLLPYVSSGGTEAASDSQGTDAQIEPLKPPWFFDCSNNALYSGFREKYTTLRQRFPVDDWSSDEFIVSIQELLLDANQIGWDHQGVFTKWASSWDIYYLCDEPNATTSQNVAEELQRDFCFYGFAVVQWMGVYAQQHFNGVGGMGEWALNAHKFVNDASKANAMHFLDSSGWPVKLEYMTRILSNYYVKHQKEPPGSTEQSMETPEGRPAFIIPSVQQRPFRSELQAHVKRLHAVAISYHTALIREPLVFWAEMLHDRFQVETQVHVLDPDAKSSADIKGKHAHCRFASGVWCASDERLLKLNRLLEDIELDCERPGDHKTRHHYIASTDAYYELFVQEMGHDAELRAADLFLCGEPVYFCRLLAFFGKPVVGYISTPLSVAVARKDRARWYEDFYKLALDPKHIFAVTTPIFGEMITYATGLSLPVVRPACLYTNAVYYPVRQREVLLLRTVSIFWNTECVLNYFAREAIAVGLGGISGDMDPLKFRESTGISEKKRAGYGTFAEFRAVVIYPYAFSQFWFYEFYSMGMPLFLPSPRTLPLYVYQDYAACPDFDGERPGHESSTVHPYSPFARHDYDAMLYWTAMTDFVVMPHVEYFDTATELMLKLETYDLRAQSQKIRAEHQKNLGAATTFWYGVLERISSEAT